VSSLGDEESSKEEKEVVFPPVNAGSKATCSRRFFSYSILIQFDKVSD
jgi:hypothetical protein